MEKLYNHITHLQRAIRYSLTGLKTAFINELAFQQETLVLLLLVPLGIWLGKTGAERALLVGSWLLVIITELINSAIESTVDRVGYEHHKLSGRAKDFGAAAVFCAIVLAISIWIIILLSNA